MTKFFLKRGFILKKIILITLLFILVISFSGYRRKNNTELHYWTTGDVTYQTAEIIYEIYGDPTKIIDGFYFEKNDIVLNIKYGWNEEKN